MKYAVALKYALDRLVGAILIVIGLPLFVLISVAIWIDDGSPILFTQQRLGFEGRPFRIFKFRSMVRDADAMLGEDGTVSANRLTRVGRVLRFTSLDELPQLLNILRGEMSFIGPRPTLLEHYERYTREQIQRFRMRPGITGMAQINGRNTLRWSQRIAYDLYYVENYSLRLDLKILLRTIRVWLLRDGIVPDRNPGQVDDLAPPAIKEATSGEDVGKSDE